MDYRVLYAGMQAIFGLLFITLFYLRHTDDRGEKFDKLDVLYMLLFISTVLDAIWVYIDGVPEHRLWHIVHQAIYLSVLSLMGYTLFLYTLDSLPAQSMKLRKYRLVLGIPVLFVVVMTLFSFKTGLMYTVDEGGRYIRGPMQPLAVGLSFGYLILGSFVALYCRREALFTMDKRRFAAIALYPIPVLVLSVVQFMLPPGLPAAQGGALISLLLIYGTSQNALITRDYLTGLPNRYTFEQKLLERMGRYRIDGYQHLYLIEGDLDKFKSINDTYGHPVGDRALQEAARLLSAFFAPLDITVFRIGGDEFMMIAETVKPLDIETIQQGLNQKLSEAEGLEGATLSMSLGCEEYDGSGDLRAFIEKTDRRLYIAKNGA